MGNKASTNYPNNGNGARIANEGDDPSDTQGHFSNVIVNNANSGAGAGGVVAGNATLHQQPQVINQDYFSSANTAASGGSASADLSSRTTSNASTSQETSTLTTNNSSSSSSLDSVVPHNNGSAKNIGGYQQQQQQQQQQQNNNGNSNHYHLELGNSNSNQVNMIYASDNKKVTVEDFELLKVIGKGNFAKVMQVRKKDTGVVMAMKILTKEALKQRDQIEHTKTGLFVVLSSLPFIIIIVFF